LVERMSFAQVGDKPYLYLATSSLSDREKSGGRIVKCSINEDGLATGCAEGKVPPGLVDADLIHIRDIRIVRTSAWLVTGRETTSARVYQCPINQQTGDLETCSDAGNVDGAVRNFGIAVR